jgi:choline dehydrogenase-like flavoprotein
MGLRLRILVHRAGVLMASAVAKKEPAKPVGRKKALLQPDLEQTLLDYIRIGTPVRVAVASAGVSERSFYSWVNRGRAERERLATVKGAKQNASEVVFVQFLQSVERAKAEAITKKVAVIAKSGNDGDWRAAAWWLERQMPEEFGKTDRVEIGGTNGEAIKIQVEIGDLENKIAKVLAIRKK